MNHLIAALTIVSASFAAMPDAKAQANPDAARTNAARGRCADPWVALALDDVYGAGRWGKALCPIKLYNDGRWNSYADLVSYVRGVQAANAIAKVKLITCSARPGSIFAMLAGQIKAVLPPQIAGNDTNTLLQAANEAVSNFDGGTLGCDRNVAGRVPTAFFGTPSRYTLQDASKQNVSYGPNVLSVPR